MQRMTTRLIGFVVLCCIASAALIYLGLYCQQVETEPVLPQHQANWANLRLGMSKDEVVDLLGESLSKEQPGKIQPGPDSNMLQTYISLAFIKCFLPDLWYDLCYERWHYGQFEMFENLIRPSDKAYVVYFGPSGKVVSFRKPIDQVSQE